MAIVFTAFACLTTLTKAEVEPVIDRSTYDPANPKLRVVRELGDRAFHVPSEIHALAVSPDGTMLATGGVNLEHRVRLWDAATGKELRDLSPFDELLGHVGCLAFTPDGQKILAGDKSGNVAIWDIQSGAKIAKYRMYSGRVLSLAVAPDGKSFATHSVDGWLQVNSIDSLEKELWAVETEQKYSGGLSQSIGATLAYTPDGKTLVVGFTQTGQILVVNASTGAIEGRIENAHGGGTGTPNAWGQALQSIAITPDGQRIVSGGNRSMKRSDVSPDIPWSSTSVPISEVKVWDLASRKLVRDLTEHRIEGGLGRLCLTPDGTQAIVCQATEFQIVDIASGNIVMRIPFNCRNLSCAPVAFPKSLTFAADDGNTVALWDFSTGRRISSTNPQHRQSVQSVDWRITSTPYPSAQRGGGSILGKARDHTGEFVATGDGRGHINLWDAKTGEHLLEEGFGPGGKLWKVKFSPGDKFLAACGSTLDSTGSDIGAVKLWPFERDNRFSFPLLSDAYDVAFSPDKSQIAIAYNFGGRQKLDIEIWDIQSQRRGFELPRDRKQRVSPSNSMQFSLDGQHLLTASYDGTVMKWDTTGAGNDEKQFVANPEPMTPEGEPNSVYIINSAFTQDGRQLITASSHTGLYVWDVATGKLSGRLELPECDQGYRFAISADGRRLAATPAGFYGNNLHVFDLARFKELASIPLDDERIASIAFSPDGKQLITGLHRGTALIWEIAIGE